MEFVIYHNPKCSKSRQALSILESKGAKVTIKLYLEDPLNENQIETLLKKLRISARDLIRRSEDDFRRSDLSLNSEEHLLLSFMANHPRIIERPIVVCGERAVLGRPPENVLELFEDE